MTRLLLATFLLLPAFLMAQDTTTCSQLTIDVDGDLQIGAGDILMILGGYGTDLDVDGDMMPDCQDDCVGAYDTCGVCNGPGPQVLAIDTIIITFDSIYVETIDDWLIFELDRDTVLHFVCENPGCTDPIAENFDPYAEEGGFCSYLSCFGPELDGRVYEVAEVGEQCWFAENLKTSVYSNGDAINSGIFYGQGMEPNGEFQRFYSWEVVTNDSGLCPSGWHVPTSEDWAELLNFLAIQGYQGIEAIALKSTYGWNYTGDNSGNDIFGFSGFPTGRWHPTEGNQLTFGQGAIYWGLSMSETKITASLWYNQTDLYIDHTPGTIDFSYVVRCLRDAE